MTKIIENLEGDDGHQEMGTGPFQLGKVSSNTNEYQFFAVKLAATDVALPSCVESCTLVDDKVADPVIKSDYCLTDNVCYMEGSVAEIFGRPCLMCQPSQSQKKWTFGPIIGDQKCFIDNVCFDKDDAKTFRESRSKTHHSECQLCDPSSNGTGWSVKPGFVVTDQQLPNDCANLTTTT